MTLAEPRRVGRPAKTSREQILVAAELCDAEELQLTTLAAQLGIAVKTVYNYFPTRKALLDAVTERSVQRLGLPDVVECTTWQDVLTRAALWAYELGRDHSGWYTQNASSIGVGLQALHLITTRMTELGWGAREATIACATVTNWAVSTGETAHRTVELGGLDEQSVLGLLTDFAEPEIVGEVSALLTQLTLDEVFDQGLQAVLAGVERTLL